MRRGFLRGKNVGVRHVLLPAFLASSHRSALLTPFTYRFWKSLELKSPIGRGGRPCFVGISLEGQCWSQKKAPFGLKTKGEDRLR
jgi:hypothetical protein